MKGLKPILLLGILAMSFCASTCFVSVISAKRQAKGKWFYWDVYLYFPDGLPMPYRMDSNLSWANLDYFVESEDLYVIEKVVGKRFFFFRGVEDKLDFNGDEAIDGTYTLEMAICWEWPVDYVPGERSIGGKFKLRDGTGYFEGIKAHGSAWVECATDPDYGFILIQRQVGIIQPVGSSK